MKTILGAIALFFTSAAVFSQTGPTPLTSVKEGVYYFQNMYSTTVLELKDGQFRYWFRSDMRSWREPIYPVTGKYATNGGMVILPRDGIYQTNWTSMSYQGQTTLWRTAALKYWEEAKKADPWGVLYPTAEKPEEIWKREGFKKK